MKHSLKLLLFICACNGATSSQQQESFKDFYQRFHEDSLFQVTRIQFPLPGINTDSMELDDTVFFWKEESWKTHNLPVSSSEIQINNIIEKDTLVTEKITTNNPGFFIERTLVVMNSRP